MCRCASRASGAISLKADKLLLLTDRLPETREGALLHELTAHEAQDYLDKASPGRDLARALRCALKGQRHQCGEEHGRE